jgi:hypothetical protein
MGGTSTYVLGRVVPPGTSVRVQLVAPADAAVPGSGPFVDVLISETTSAP